MNKKLLLDYFSKKVLRSRTNNIPFNHLSNRLKVLSISLFTLFLGLTSFTSSAQIDPGTVFDLNTHINDRIDAGETNIVVAPGRYRVPQFGGNTHLYFQNRSNITIIADGVEMICTSTVQAVTMQNCDNFKIQGLTVDYDPLPFTQGEIVSMSGDKLTLTVDLFNGYPSTNISNHCEIYDPTTGELVTQSYYNVSYNVNQGARQVTITKPAEYTASYSFEEIGDVVVMSSHDGNNIPHAFVADQCTNLTLENTIVYASTSMGYLENYCSSSSYVNCKVKRRPLASDIKTRAIKRMRTTNIDGFHSKFANVGPSYTGCEVEYNGDDGFAINGDYEVVMATSGNTMEVVGKAGEDPDIDVGDSIEIISYNGERLADAVVTGFSMGRAVSQQEKTFLQNQTYYAEAYNTYTASNIFDVTIDRSISLPMGSIISDASKVGNGFEITNCTVRGNRARGVSVKAGNGSISGNTFTNNWLTAINSSPEFTWLESGTANSLVVSNNNISGCHGAAIAIYGKGSDGTTSPAGMHNSVQVINNIISGSSNPGIALTSHHNLTLSGNSISSPNNSLLLPYMLTDFGRDTDPNNQIYLLNNSSGTVSVTGVTLISEISLSPTQTYQLTENVLPSGATNKNVTWASNNPSVASVSTSGLVTAANITGTQTATITVTTVDGSFTAQCLVTVSEVPDATPIVHFEFDESSGATSVVNTGTDTGVSAILWENGGTITPGVSDAGKGQVVQVNCNYDGQINLQKSGGNYSGITGGGARTYAFWIKQNAVDFAAFLYNGVSGSGSLFNVQISGGKVRLTDENNNWVYTSETLNTGQWHHIALVVPQNANIQDLQFYINGVASSQTYGGTNVAINTGSGSFLIGAKLNGYLSGFKLFDSALTSAQVTELYNPSPPPATYTLTVANGTGDGDYADGTSVNIVADAPSAGEMFDSWELTSGTAVITDVNASSTTVTTSGAASTVTALYVPIPTYTLTVANGTGDGDYEDGTSVNIVADAPSAGQMFDSWELTSGTAVITDVNASSTTVTTSGAASTVTALYVPIPTYTLTVTNGTGDGDYEDGTSVNIVADAPSAGQMFDSWELTTGTAVITDVNASSTTVTTSGAASTVTALYVPIPTYTLTVANGTGDGDYEDGTSVNIEADVAPAGQEFDVWQLTSGTAVITDINASSTTVTTSGAASTVTATYSDILYTLTVANGTGDGDYADGTSVNVDADAPSAGEMFDSWELTSGTAVITDINASSTTVTTSGEASTVTALYVPIPTYTLTVANGTGDGDYADGTSVNIVADAPAAGEMFDSWELTSGTAVITDINASSTTVTTSGEASTVTALYVPIPTYTLTVANGTGDGDYADGTSVNIVADAPAAGEMFDSWELTSGTAVITDVNASSTTVTTSGSASTVTALYVPIPTYTLTVTNGTGDGDYADGTSVNIEADIAPEGQEFDVWQLTSGTAVITDVNASSTTVTTSGAASTVMATYKDLPFACNTTIQAEDAIFGGGAALENQNLGFNGSGYITLSKNNEFVDFIVEGCNVGTYNLQYRYALGSNNKNGSLIVNGVTQSLSVASTGSWTTYTTANIAIDLINGSNTIRFESGGPGLCNIDEITLIPPTYTLTVVNGTGDGDYEDGTSVNIVADAPSAGEMFDSWELTSGTAVITDVNASSTTVTTSGVASTVTALYVPIPTYTLTVANGTGDGDYENGTSVNIVADAPSAGEMFDSWELTSGTAVITDVNASSTTVTTSGEASTVTALYVPIPTYTLTVANGTGDGDYEDGTSVNIVADAPSAGEMFDSWELTSGTTVITDVNASSTTVTTSGSASTVTALYVPIPTYTLTVANGTGDGDYEDGTSVNIVADAPSAGEMFDSWELTSGTAVITDVNTSSTTVTTSGAASTVTALYVPIPTYTLTVANGTGDGDYEDGTSVNIVADAPSAGEMFDSWELTSGTAVITDVNASSTTVTTSGAASTVTALYVPIPTYTLTVANGTGDGDYEDGTSVNIVADAPSAGEMFDSWELTSGTAVITDANASSTTVTTSGTASTVTALYVPIPTYTLTVANGTGDGDYEDGTSVNIDADTAPSGQEFDKWVLSSGTAVITDVNASSTTVTTSGEASTITATYIVSNNCGDTLQAESATSGNGGFIDTRFTGYNGSGVYNFPASGGYVDFTVNGCSSGLYTLTYRYALLGGNKTGLLVVNGVSQNLNMSDTGGWSNYGTGTVDIILTTGLNTIRFQSSGQDFGNLDEISLTAKCEGTYQAEGASYGNGGFIDTRFAGFNGSGVYNFPANGGYVEYTVNGCSSGLYTLTYRYALLGGNKTGLLVVNGVSQNLNMSDTGGWSNYGTGAVDIILTGGLNTIRFQSSGQDFGNLDEISLTAKCEGTYQAEGASYGNGGFIDTRFAGFNGSGVYNFPANGGYVEYTVNGCSSGLYTLTYRYALLGGNKTGLLVVNGVSQNLNMSDTGGWSNYGTGTVDIILTSGLNTIRFQSSGQDFGNLDEISLTAKCEGTYQAETSTYGNGGFIDSRFAGFNGSGVYNFPANGGYVEYNVNGCTSGQYTVTYRYALGDVNKTGALIVNGVSQNLTMTGTGSWSNYATGTVNITLVNGSNTLRFQSSGQDFGNLDEISISSLAVKSSFENIKAIDKTIETTIEDNLDLLIKVYPNPVKRGDLNIKLTGYKEVSKLEIFDIRGRLVYSNLSVEKSDILIDVSDFESALYYLQVHADGIIKSKKIIIE